MIALRQLSLWQVGMPVITQGQCCPPMVLHIGDVIYFLACVVSSPSYKGGTFLLESPKQLWKDSHSSTSQFLFCSTYSHPPRLGMMPEWKVYPGSEPFHSPLPKSQETNAMGCGVGVLV